LQEQGDKFLEELSISQKTGMKNDVCLNDYDIIIPLVNYTAKLAG
jgi:hypothetical protein